MTSGQNVKWPVLNIYRIAVRRYAEVCFSDEAQHLGISQKAGRNVCRVPQRQTVIRFHPREVVRESDLRTLWILQQRIPRNSRAAGYLWEMHS